MIPNSIRWNLQMWLAFLLICLLSSFGVVIYQLQHVNRFRQVDDELERRLAVLSGDVRTSPPPDFGKWRFHGPGGPGGPGRDKFDRDFGHDHFQGPPPGDRPPFDPPPNKPDWLDRRDGPGPNWPTNFAQFKITREIRVSQEVERLFYEPLTNAFYFAVWSPDGTLMKSSTNTAFTMAKPADARDTSTHIQTRENLREAYLFTGLGECILVGKNIATDQLALSHFALWILTAGGAVLILGLSVGWWLTVRALRPVEEISAAASRISGGSLSERIRTADPDNEIGRLAAVLNSTFARLETAFSQQRQFTADASHELRTPLAVIISEAQTTLARERSQAEYRETIEVCLAAAQQMGKLTQSLLQLARYDAGQEPIERRHFSLSKKAGDCVGLIESLARDRNITICPDLAEVEVFGDIDRIAQVVTNLLSNAIQYNKDHGEIRISTRLEADVAVLTIADTGCGIPAEDLPHVFERFYRADKSRANGQGHCGLGLAICKTIVDAHGGTIEMSSQPGVGTTCTVRFPREAGPAS